MALTSSGNDDLYSSVSVLVFVLRALGQNTDENLSPQASKVDVKILDESLPLRLLASFGYALISSYTVRFRASSYVGKRSYCSNAKV